MALTLTEAATLAIDTTWVARVTAAVERALVSVVVDVSGKTKPYNDTDRARLALARKVIPNILDQGKIFAWLMACDQVIDPATVTDSALVTRIYNVWPYVADLGTRTTTSTSYEE